MPPIVLLKKELLQRAIAGRQKARPAEYFDLLPKRLYKYVDYNVADSVGRGSIKLGLVSGYSSLENGRQDDIEGNAVVHPTRVSLASGETSAARAGMAEMGLVGLGAVSIHAAPGAVKFSTVGPDYVAYCLSKVPDSSTLLGSGNQVVFEITDVEMFALRLLSKLKITRMWAGEVAYEARVFSDFGHPGYKGFHPLLKRPVRESDNYQFHDEQEFRFFMSPRASISTAPYDHDPVIAKLLRRL